MNSLRVLLRYRSRIVQAQLLDEHVQQGYDARSILTAKWSQAAISARDSGRWFSGDSCSSPARVHQCMKMCPDNDLSGNIGGCVDAADIRESIPEA